ncbi:MAG: sensor histidine kinase [Cyanobacteria bacterium J06627_8]
MNSPRFLPPAFRYVEWFFVAVHVVMQFDSSSSVLPKLAFCLAFLLPSCFFPISRPLYQRVGYLFLVIGSLACGKFLGVSLDFLIYLYVAKSCFLLNLKGVICVTSITGVVWVLGEYVSELIEYQSELASLEPVFRFEPPYGFGLYTPRTLAIYAFCLYLGCSVAMIVFSYAIIAERKSRQQAELLTNQVEALAASLERTRIARDIHDSIGHTLTDLDMQLEVARALRDSELDQSFQAMDNAKVLANQCIEDVSQAIQMLRQPEFNLKQALVSLIEQATDQYILRINLDIDLPKLSPYLKHQLYCILKEGIVNIQKHACASCIDIHAQVIPGGVSVALRDNGIGFTPSAPMRGFGLKGMIERAQLLGGELKIHSTIGQGTHIQITLPL